MKISLILACYNVSNYIDKLYHLLISQPYKNVEFIFVEDCSTDNTRNELLALNDPRIHIILNEKNIGAANSRNRGIEQATGDYIWFPDPDDLFDTELLVKVSKIIAEFSPDVVSVGMQERHEINGKLLYEKDILSKFNGLIKEDFNLVLVNLEETLLFGYTNNKFYKKEIIDKYQIRNKHQALKEDFEFNVKVFNVISNFYILNEPLYFYMKRNNSSLTTKFVPDYFTIHMKTLSSFISLLQTRGELSQTAIKLLVNRFIRYALSAIERNTSPHAKLTFKAQRKWIINHIFNQDHFRLMENNPHLITKKQKPIYFLLKYKMASLLVVLGNFVKVVKTKLPIFFTKLKG
ncbi:glycosyltransferase family 2 protein [Pelistega ratti]|uniref:glycosyltransferase family 2 protein n=1 Tax=Pelistega ratti TaxID=2652177 RepID=UPI00135A8558|nr:glycosyltransferase family 2 protein [Pelistega ratti]